MEKKCEHHYNISFTDAFKFIKNITYDFFFILKNEINRILT